MTSLRLWFSCSPGSPGFTQEGLRLSARPAWLQKKTNVVILKDVLHSYRYNTWYPDIPCMILSLSSVRERAREFKSIQISHHIYTTTKSKGSKYNNRDKIGTAQCILHAAVYFMFSRGCRVTSLYEVNIQPAQQSVCVIMSQTIIVCVCLSWLHCLPQCCVEQVWGDVTHGLASFMLSLSVCSLFKQQHWQKRLTVHGESHTWALCPIVVRCMMGRFSAGFQPRWQLLRGKKTLVNKSCSHGFLL